MSFLFSKPPGFREHSLVRGPHAQTVLPLFLPADRLPYVATQHRLCLDDGDCLVVHEDRPPGWRSGQRMALLVHGLNGSHASPYMSRLAAKLTARGFRVFRMDMRGCGAGLHLAEGVFHADRSDDLAHAVRWLAQQDTRSPLTLIGFSLGANLAIKLLGRDDCDVNERVDSLLAVSPPIDLDSCCRLLASGLGRMYDEFFARALWRNFCQRRRRIRGAERLTVARRPRTLLEFDTAVTAPLAGYRSVTEYYDEASAGKDLTPINVPTAILIAEDDPIIPPVVYRDCHLPHNVQLFTAPRGGHLGFLGHAINGRGERIRAADRRWMDWRLVEWVVERDLATT